MARLALLSTFDKTGLVELGRSLVEEFEFDLISSGGTAQALQTAGIPVIKVSDYTGSPEILGGRVKTLHPRIHGGILARQDLEADLAELAAHQIRPIALVVVNLYPFEQTIAQPDVTLPAAIEQIDIGGPAMLRAAAKNFAHLTVLCSPAQYGDYLTELRQHGGASLEFRRSCARQAFMQTATYDRAIANYLEMDLEKDLEKTEINQNSTISTVATAQSVDIFLEKPVESTVQPTAQPTAQPIAYGLSGTLLQPLRYGENPHQPAAWYQTGTTAIGWTAAEKLQGKELSYNNLIDLEATRQIIAEFPPSQAAAAIVKHTNPCGVALGRTLLEAYQKAFNADSTSAFGGIVAFNRAIDPPTATALTQTFLECVFAPGCEPEAQEILNAKSKVRVLILPHLVKGETHTVRTIAGGFLVQTADDQEIDPTLWRTVSDRTPTAIQFEELVFAWKIAKHVKSNAIVVTSDRTTLGIGAGQMNRVGSVKIALEQAGEKARGAILASDGFFPFDDSVRQAAAAGIAAIVQPGGSVRDQDSVQAANELGLVMIFTGVRHFLH